MRNNNLISDLILTHHLLIMRTRFLCTDYFNSAPRRNYDFLSFPLPHLPPPNICSFEELNCLDLVTTLPTDTYIGKLPIDGALSRFLSDILPHRIDVDLSEFAASPPDFEDQIRCSVRANEPTTSDLKIKFILQPSIFLNIQPKGTTVPWGKGKDNLEMVQFEILELDPSSLSPLGGISCFEKESKLIPPRISDDETMLDMPTLEVGMHLETLQSIYSVDDICSLIFKEKSSDLMEDSGFSEGQYNSSTDVFSLLEVVEGGLGISSESSMEKVLLPENIQLHCRSLGSEGKANKSKLLDFTKFATLQHLSDGCLTMGSAKIEGGGPHSFSTPNEIENMAEEFLNFLPVERNLNGGSIEALQRNEACSPTAEHAEFSLRSEQHSGRIHGHPEAVVIVNTHNFDEDMVIARRSTYQKILAFEKKGVQIVERDLRQPVDFVVSASACLAWYDCKNIAKKSTASNGAFSCLSVCVENIAADILLSLSFAFSGCILVFEGESDFIARIMDSSYLLYAAAASLCINIQVFYSYSSEMTDEIILSCIEQSSRTSRRVYPKMPESQTLAESFLTAFPVFNPLSAHAILSSADSLAGFLGVSYEHPIEALKDYQVPDESIRLLGVLTRFGEREDSKSGMTDCSSSVASAPNPKSLHSKRTSGGEKRKSTWDSGDLNMPMTGLFDLDPPRLLSESRLRHRTESGVHDSWTEDLNLVKEFEKSDLSFDNKSCFQGHSFDNYLTEDLSKVTELCYYPLQKDPQMDGKFNKLEASQNDLWFQLRQSAGVGMMNELDRQTRDSGKFAVHSAQSQKYSPCPKEFRNRTRKKSLPPKRAFPRDLSAPCRKYPGESSKATKLKNSSILDYYNYQGNSSQRAATRRERQLTEGIQQLPASTSEKASHQLNSERTPVDKRGKKGAVTHKKQRAK